MDMGKNVQWMDVNIYIDSGEIESVSSLVKYNSIALHCIEYFIWSCVIKLTRNLPLVQKLLVYRQTNRIMIIITIIIVPLRGGEVKKITKMINNNTTAIMHRH